MTERSSGTYPPVDTSAKPATGGIFPHVIADRAKTFPPYIDPNEVLAAAIGLFARVPSLPQRLLERAQREVAADKVAPFFDYLFVGTASPAIGANYNVVGYRLRDVDEGNPVDGAANVDLTKVDGSPCRF